MLAIDHRGVRVLVRPVPAGLSDADAITRMEDWLDRRHPAPGPQLVAAGAPAPTPRRELTRAEYEQALPKSQLLIIRGVLRPKNRRGA